MLLNKIAILRFEETLEPKIPVAALNYCVELWKQNPFHFKITQTRNTCLGNYKHYKGEHTITVNHDLNPYNFAITYIHEVAHMHVQLAKYKKSLPHGREWKYHFQRLMIPLLNEQVFPLEVLKPLALHMKNPKASSTRDANLLMALRQFNDSKNELLTIGELSNNSIFNFRGRLFQKKETRRTRAMCLCVETKQKYTISLAAEIELVST
jgi:SprT protein